VLARAWLHDRNADDAAADRLLTCLPHRCTLPTARGLVVFALP